MPWNIRLSLKVTVEALRLAKLAEDAGIKNGAEQNNKLWLPSFRYRER